MNERTQDQLERHCITFMELAASLRPQFDAAAVAFTEFWLSLPPSVRVQIIRYPDRLKGRRHRPSRYVYTRRP